MLVPAKMLGHFNKETHRTLGCQGGGCPSSGTRKIGPCSLPLGKISDFQQRCYYLKRLWELTLLPSVKMLVIVFYEILALFFWGEGVQSYVIPLWSYCHFIAPHTFVVVLAYSVHHWHTHYRIRALTPHCNSCMWPVFWLISYKASNGLKCLCWWFW